MASLRIGEPPRSRAPGPQGPFVQVLNCPPKRVRSKSAMKQRNSLRCDASGQTGRAALVTVLRAIFESTHLSEEQFERVWRDRLEPLLKEALQDLSDADLELVATPLGQLDLSQPEPPGRSGRRNETKRGG